MKLTQKQKEIILNIISDIHNSGDDFATRDKACFALEAIIEFADVLK